MKTFTKLTLSVLLLVCAFGNATAQDFWQELTPIEDHNPLCMATNSKGHIYLGTRTSVFRSTDSGQSWKEVLHHNPGWGAWPAVYSITINDADHIYISSNVEGKYLMRSEDDGETWENIPIPANLFNSIYCVGTDTIYGGTIFEGDGIFYSSVVYRTYDRGANWDALYICPDESSICGEGVMDMVLTSDGVLYAGTLGYHEYGGLYRSFDQGNTWEQINPEEIYSVSDLAINSKDDIFIVCYVSETYVLRSGATTAERLQGVVYPNSSVVVDHADYIYIAIGDGGLSSYDDGVTFNSIPGAIQSSNYHAGKDNYLYAFHPSFNTVYRSTFPILSTGKQFQYSIDFRLFPNPANDFLTIQLQGNKNSTVSIYDVLGNELLKTAITDNYNMVNISSLSSGIYIIQVQSSNQTITSKFIKN